MSREAIAIGAGGPIFVNETLVRQGILATALFINDTIPAPIPPSPPPPSGIDPNGVQGSGGGPPRPRRPTLHLDERFRPSIVDPREYAAKRPDRREIDARSTRDEIAPESIRDRLEIDLPPLPDVPRRMPDDLAARVEASIAAAERKRALAELAADDEEAILAILAAWEKQETGR